MIPTQDRLISHIRMYRTASVNLKKKEKEKKTALNVQHHPIKPLSGPKIYKTEPGDQMSSGARRRPYIKRELPHHSSNLPDHPDRSQKDTAQKNLPSCF